MSPDILLEERLLRTNQKSSSSNPLPVGVQLARVILFGIDAVCMNEPNSFQWEAQALMPLQALIVVSPTVPSGDVYIVPGHFDDDLSHGDQS